MAEPWHCGHCGGINLPATDCLWCLGWRKQLIANMRNLANYLDSEQVMVDA